MEIDISLAKLKYRNPSKRWLRRDKIDPEFGTWTFNAGRFKSPGNNSGTKYRKSRKTLRSRRRAWGPMG